MIGFLGDSRGRCVRCFGSRLDPRNAFGSFGGPLCNHPFHSQDEIPSVTEAEPVAPRELVIAYHDGRVVSHEQAAFQHLVKAAFPFLETGGIVEPGEVRYVGEISFPHGVRFEPIGFFRGDEITAGTAVIL